MLRFTVYGDMYMDLSIILVNLNTKELLYDALAALPEACSGLVYETIVVDNGSSDGSPAMVREQFPGAQLIVNQRNVGFAAANNQAFEVAHSDLILLLNTDTRAAPGSISALVQFIHSHPQAGIAGPRLINLDGTFQGSAANFPTIPQESLLLLGNLSRHLRGPVFPFHQLPPELSPRQVDWVSGACLLIRRIVIDQIGPLDEGYFMYTEETDWCYRAKQAGWEIWWVPEPVVLHYNGATAKQTHALKRWQVYGSKIRFFRKHHGRAAAWMFAAAVWITSLIKTVGWGGIALLSTPERRDRARHNVRAYLELLRRGVS